jgi:hypothetical protein
LCELQPPRLAFLREPFRYELFAVASRKISFTVEYKATPGKLKC